MTNADAAALPEIPESPKASPGANKLRRLISGVERPTGRAHQLKGTRVERINPARIKTLEPDPSLSGCGGLVAFGEFARRHGVDRELATRFSHLKSGLNVVYPMEDVLRTLIDAQIAGESRIFGIERLCADPVFRALAGGEIPGVDTMYRDLERFDDETLVSLEELMAAEGLRAIKTANPSNIHVDIDTTVESLFSTQRERQCSDIIHGTAAGRAIIRLLRGWPRSETSASERSFAPAIPASEKTTSR